MGFKLLQNQTVSKHSTRQERATAQQTMRSLFSIFRIRAKSLPEGIIVTAEDMERFLTTYDKDRDRHLDVSELKAAFEDLGAHFPARRAEQALAVADRDLDGHISFSELRDLLNYAIERGYKIRQNSTPSKYK